MMPHLDTILNVFKRNDPIPNLLIRYRCVPRREEVFEDLADAFSEGGGEAFEKQVWVGFGDCAARGRGEIVAQQDVV